jgi:geranylgeranyl diphosphate synthase type II
MDTAIADDVITSLRITASEVDAAMRRWLDGPSKTPLRLLEAMRYSLEAGGKRLRPALVLWSAQLCGSSPSAAMPAALAVECVHTFSLIHDDLPALDNDDLRRGRPTSHKAFGEAAAILAGDGLLALAFEILATDSHDAASAIAMVRELAAATGWRGMIGGEAADIEGEKQPPSVAIVEQIHAAKTARLIEACCRLGAIAAQADSWQEKALVRYGKNLGLAFQAADDLLDETGAAESLGKPVRRDHQNGKQTYPRVVGVEASRRLAEDLTQKAIDSLEPFGEQAARLIALARYVVAREC